MSEYYKTYFKKNTKQPEAAATPVINQPEPNPLPVPPVPTPSAPVLEEKKPEKGSSWGTKLLITVLLLIILGGGAGGYFYYQNYYLPTQKDKVLGTESKDEKKQLLEEVGKLVVLPSEENPTVATVVNVEKLRQTQPFFDAARDGDKLIIYSKKAILYRPEEKKVVDIGPVTQEEAKEATSSSQLDLNPAPTSFTTIP